MNESKIAQTSKIIRTAIRKANRGSLMLLATDYCDYRFRMQGEAGCLLCVSKAACEVYTNVQSKVFPMLKDGKRIFLNDKDLIIPKQEAKDDNESYQL
jgi:hypothetical protein